MECSHCYVAHLLTLVSHLDARYEEESHSHRHHRKDRDDHDSHEEPRDDDVEPKQKALMWDR